MFSIVPRPGFELRTVYQQSGALTILSYATLYLATLPYTYLRIILLSYGTPYLAALPFTYSRLVLFTVARPHLILK